MPVWLTMAMTILLQCLIRASTLGNFACSKKSLPGSRPSSKWKYVVAKLFHYGELQFHHHTTSVAVAASISGVRKSTASGGRFWWWLLSLIPHNVCSFFLFINDNICPVLQFSFKKLFGNLVPKPKIPCPNILNFVIHNNSGTLFTDKHQVSYARKSSPSPNP